MLHVRLAEAPSDDAGAVADDGGGGSTSGEAGSTVASKSLGVTLEPLTPDAARAAHLKASAPGVLVKDVRRGGPAEGKLVPGDVITDVIHPEPKTATRTIAELQRVLKASGAETTWVCKSAGSPTRRAAARPPS